MAASVDPVQHQQVKVDAQVQRAAEALDQGHGAGLRGRWGQSRLADQVRGDRPVDDAEHGRQGGRFGGKQEAQRERHAQHPLAQRLPGQHGVDQQRRRLHHPPGVGSSGKSPGACS